VFANVLEAHARKGPFEPQDVLVFNHGVKFLGQDGLSTRVAAAISKVAKMGALQVKTATTKVGTEVYVFLGDKAKTAGGIVNSFSRRQKHLAKISDILESYWGGFDWWLWFETEESLYE